MVRLRYRGHWSPAVHQLVHVGADLGREQLALLAVQDADAAAHRAQFLGLLTDLDVGQAAVVAGVAARGVIAPMFGTVPAGGRMWQDGATSFLHRGEAGRWRELLTPAQGEAYAKRAQAELGADCARWLEQGGEIGRP